MHFLCHSNVPRDCGGDGENDDSSTPMPSMSPITMIPTKLSNETMVLTMSPTMEVTKLNTPKTAKESKASKKIIKSQRLTLLAL